MDQELTGNDTLDQSEFFADGGPRVGFAQRIGRTGNVTLDQRNFPRPEGVRVAWQTVPVSRYYSY